MRERHDDLLERPAGLDDVAASESAYSPSETESCATETGIATTPVTDSAALANGSSATAVTAPSRPSASWRARTDSGSFLRGRRFALAIRAFLRNLRSMPATTIDGKALAAKVREEVAAAVAELGHVGLATVLVGDDPASHIYIDLKQKAAAGAGMEARDIKLPEATSEAELLATIAELNADDAVDGLLVQLPLPKHIDENRSSRRSRRRRTSTASTRSTPAASTSAARRSCRAPRSA